MTIPEFRPPVKPGGIGDKIARYITALATWYAQTPFGQLSIALWDKVKFITGKDGTGMEKRLISLLSTMPNPGGQLLGTILSTLSGQATTESGLLRSDAAQIIAEIIRNPSSYLTNLKRAIERNPPGDFAAHEIGKLIANAYLLPLRRYVDTAKDDPERATFEIIGYSQGIVIAVQAFGTIAEILGIGQIQSIAIMLAKLVDSLGIGNITHTLLSPLLNEGYGEYNQRFYNARFRPRRWSVSELTQLYAIGKISPSEFARQMAEHGYEDRDISLALDVSQRPARVTDIFAGLDLNVITRERAVYELRKLGYEPEAIDLMIEVNDAREKHQDLNSLAQIALEAFRKSLISEAEFRTLRRQGGVPEDRINIEVRLAQLDIESKRKELSVGQIKSAYINNILARQEADYYLSLLSIDSAARQVLLETWNEEIRVKPLQLNSSTISAAYRSGVLNYDQAIDKLTSIGWSKDNAILIIDIAGRRRGDSTRKLSQSGILSAYMQGILTYDETIARLREIGYSDADANIMIDMARIKPAAPAKAMTKSEIINLYEKGMTTFEETVDELTKIGYDPDTATMVLIANASNIKSPDDIPS